MPKNVLVIGGGGREHAIVWKISENSEIQTIFVAPGSYGIQQVTKARNVDLNLKDFNVIANFCIDEKICLVIVGPEEPLANGIANYLLDKGIAVFGPEKNAAQIESDKNWSKLFMNKYNIPTAKWKSFQNSNEAKEFIQTTGALVVKASGLAAGKGVIVAKDKKEACEAVDEILTNQKFGLAGQTIIVEELLEGEEVSVLAFCDGTTIKPMLPSQDHKRIFDDDKGANTGGMGAYSPCYLLSQAELEQVQTEVFQRTIDGFKKEQIKFVGVLYAGLMLTKTGPKVLEFNCRFGDPETEVILPLLETDLYSIMAACCSGNLKSIDLKWKDNCSAVGVVMASKGYPESSSKGQVITGIDAISNKSNYIVFHCGTAFKDNNLVTNGGRVLIIVSLSKQLSTAATNATKACETIQFDGKQFRSDIALKGIAKSILNCGQLTYKESGVDINAGNELINHLKPLAKSTNRLGVLGGLGGFGGLFDTKLAGFQDPLLVSGTDGVGTKLKIAKLVGNHRTIGIDLVAMCVNDVLAHGAEPLFFLDYFACGRLDINVAKEVISGIAEGCRQANCALIGGETAEMPDMYSIGDYDLAGFAVGAVERNELLPKIGDIKAGDLVIGLPSTGIHSNGFSLVRKVMEISGVDYRDLTPFSGKSFGEELLKPTKIYVKTIISIKSKIKAFAHITGGGLIENIPRVLPELLKIELDATKWEIPTIFSWLTLKGQINEKELLKTFNCGIGGILIVKETDIDEILKLTHNDSGRIIGRVLNKSNTSEESVVVKNFAQIMTNSMKPFIIASTINEKNLFVEKRRVAVLISGNGTNLQALIDATQNPSNSINAEIVLVISNKEHVAGLNRAKRANIPTKVINHQNYTNRIDFDRALHSELIQANIDLICLAGFMRILTGEFTENWKGKLINIHPALLPSFKGIKAQKQALEAGVRVSGCTVHFVDENVDTGLIIIQEAVPIELNDTVETLTERIKLAEHRAYPKALKLIANDKVRIDNNKLIWL